MQISEIKDESLEKHLRVVISAKEIESKVSEELATIAKTANLPGFRVGKAPVSILKNKYGAAIYDDATRKTIESTVDEIVKEREYNVVRSPRIDDLVREEGKDLEFTIIVEIVPTFDMPDLSKVSIEKPVVEPSKKEIDNGIEELRKRSAVHSKTTKGKAVDGDMTVIECRGYIDDKEFEGGHVVDHELVLGSKSFIPGFEEQLVGSKAGDKVEVKVSFPEDYHAKELAGKPAIFKTEVKEVRQKEEAKIDAEFAKKYGADSVDALRDIIKNNLAESFAESVSTLLKMRLFDELENKLSFDVSDSMIEQELTQLKAQAGDLKESEELKDKSEKEVDEYFRTIALRRVRAGLYLAEYAKKNGIQVEQKDLEAEIYKQARKFPGQEQMVFDFYSKNPQMLQSLNGSIIEEKAVNVILDNVVTLKDKKVSMDELEKILEDDMSPTSRATKKKASTKKAAPAKKAASKSDDKAEKKPAAKKTTAKK